MLSNQDICIHLISFSIFFIIENSLTEFQEIVPSVDICTVYL